MYRLTGSPSLTNVSPLGSSPDFVEQVRARLLNAICEGSLASGARLRQEDLAEALNVSRQPVLQALRLLKNDGLVVDAGRRGLMVAPLDPVLILQLYEVRAVLDGLASCAAARRKAKLDRGVIRAGRRAAASGKLVTMIDADMRFHQAIYEASGNPIISSSAARHWPHIRRAMAAVLQSQDSREQVWDEHEAIFEAIGDGDERRAERLARAHGESAGLNLSMRLNQEMADGAGTTPARKSRRNNPGGKK